MAKAAQTKLTDIAVLAAIVELLDQNVIEQETDILGLDPTDIENIILYLRTRYLGRPERPIDKLLSVLTPELIGGILKDFIVPKSYMPPGSSNVVTVRQIVHFSILPNHDGILQTAEKLRIQRQAHDYAVYEGAKKVGLVKGFNIDALGLPDAGWSDPIDVFLPPHGLPYKAHTVLSLSGVFEKENNENKVANVSPAG